MSMCVNMLLLLLSSSGVGAVQVRAGQLFAVFAQHGSTKPNQARGIFAACQNVLFLFFFRIAALTQSRSRLYCKVVLK